jgi:bidirectional [NiFe] hydrogenase diaphorase subunit
MGAVRDGSGRRPRRMLSVPGDTASRVHECHQGLIPVFPRVPPTTEPPMAPSDDKRWRIVETRMRRLGNQPDALVEALHSTQEAFGFLDTDALRYVGQTLGVPPSTVFGVATFYHYFTLKPAGEHTAVVCTGTACYINGASGILAAIRERMGIGPKQTTEDGKVSLLTARCLGACSLAPAAIVDGEVQGRVEGPALVDRLEQL